MREVVVQVPRRAAEDVLDRLLPMLPGGVRERQRGQVTELRIRGADLPSMEELLALAGRRGVRAWEHEVSDDWRERRRDDYEPEVIGGRLVVAPDWAHRAGTEIEIVLAEGSAFGAGGHPTTRRCLELLLDLSPAGSFADLGCGSGVLAVLAARLGWNPVVALDVSAASVELTQRNARVNGVEVAAAVLDLVEQAPPPSDGFAANVPPTVHARVAAALPEPIPRLGLLSGFHPAETDEVVRGYEARGLAVQRTWDVQGWSVVLAERDLPKRRR
jgi:ribosomal protein L11 methyltransferase